MSDHDEATVASWKACETVEIDVDYRIKYPDAIREHVGITKKKGKPAVHWHWRDDRGVALIARHSLRQDEAEEEGTNPYEHVNVTEVYTDNEIRFPNYDKLTDPYTLGDEIWILPHTIGKLEVGYLIPEKRKTDLLDSEEESEFAANLRGELPRID